jgi:hypothetical protein
VSSARRRSRRHELRDDLIDVIVEHAFSCSSPRSYAAMFHLKGAVSRVAEGVTAFGNWQASHAITSMVCGGPARTSAAALGRFREGVYVNFLSGDEDPDRVREAYGDSVYDWLVDVKTTYDRTGDRYLREQNATALVHV